VESKEKKQKRERIRERAHDQIGLHFFWEQFMMAAKPESDEY
jgi:hypothetical protein